MSITLNPYLMLLVFITFMFLIYVLNQWLFKPMFAFMNARDNAIARDLSNAQSHKEQTQHIDDEIAQTLALARKEAAQILETATKEAKHAYEQNINAKKAENDKKLALFKQELQEQKAQLSNELREQLPIFRNSLSAKLHQI
ncbi:F0F1 ATP synthase subunit B' [Helicobacter jaachi]|uniref:ATP synthase subunit b n=1 Tax=Helicobacter jaachi TaxID=1677920 RepID=A0A4U8TA80_9HELI|nr:FoF1 ATP synthase subunit B' [Helicobacter jaachi]TLD96028.1 F0F1 ATP synthase subunit B' [Helicobacter jaachi]